MKYYNYSIILFTLPHIKTGFPLSQLIFYVCGGLALFLLLAFVGILVVAMGYKIKKELSQRNYNTLK